MRFRSFLLFLPIAMLVMSGAPGTGWAAGAYVVLIGMWWMVLTDRRQRRTRR